MNSQRKTLLVWLIFLVGVSVSCRSLTEAIDQNSDESIVPPPLSVSDAGSGDGEQLSPEDARPGPSVLTLDDPSLYSYRETNFSTRMVFEFESIETSGYVYIDGTWASGSPPSYTFNFDTTLALWEGFVPIEYATLDGVQYGYSPGSECFIETADYENPYDDYYMDEKYLTGEAPLVESGVLVNGAVTDRYAITHENELNEEDSALYDFVALDTVGSVYVDRLSQVIVRFEQSGLGLDRSDSSDGVEIDYSLQVDFELLEPGFPITVPEGCGGEGIIEEEGFDLGGSAEDIPLPIMDDATNISGAFGLYGYDTNHAFEEIVKFYLDEIPRLGYSLDSDLVSAPSALLQFSGEHGTVVISIGENEMGSGFSVALIDTASP